MRLSAQEIASIKRLVAETYGPGALVRLFGSQLDDRRKGGDVDLMVEVEGEEGMGLCKEIRLRIALEEALGERKVDLIVHRVGEPEGAFVRIAKRDGAVL